MNKSELYSIYETIQEYKKDLEAIGDKMDAVDYEEYSDIVEHLDEAVRQLRKAGIKVYDKTKN